MSQPRIRAALALLALASLVLAGAGSVRAADPAPTIGGALAVTRQTVTVQNQGNAPATVTLTTDGPASFDPATFTLDPGQTGTATVHGQPAGLVSAHFALVTAPTIGADVAGVTLQAPFRDPAPFDPLPWLAGAVVVAGLLLTAYALTRWARAAFEVDVRINRRARP